MESFRFCSIDDLNKLQTISQTAYAEAFHDLINNEDIDDYVKHKYSLDNLKQSWKIIQINFYFLIQMVKQ